MCFIIHSVSWERTNTHTHTLRSKVAFFYIHDVAFHFKIKSEVAKTGNHARRKKRAGREKKGEERRKDGRWKAGEKSEGGLENILHSELFIHQHNLQSFEERRDV